MIKHFDTGLHCFFTLPTLAVTRVSFSFPSGAIKMAAATRGVANHWQWLHNLDENEAVPSVSVTDEAIESLAEKGFNPQFGARPIKRVIQREVLNSLSKEILAGNISPKSSILLDAFDEQLVFRNK